jgi:hypothetical protein
MGGFDLAGKLASLSALVHVLEQTLMQAKTYAVTDIEVLALHPASIVGPLRDELIPIGRSRATSLRARVAIITARFVANGLPLPLSPDLLDAIGIPQEVLFRLCPGDWSMQVWFTVLVAGVMQVHFPAHPAFAALWEWLLSQAAPSEQVERDITSVLRAIVSPLRIEPQS